MMHDVTKQIESFRDGVAKLWVTLYEEEGQPFDAELLSCFYRSIRLIFVDTVLYRVADLDYRQYVQFDFDHESEFYRPLKIALTLAPGWEDQAYVYGPSGDLEDASASKLPAQVLYFWGLSGLGDSDVVDYVEFGCLGSVHPVGMVKYSYVSKYILRES